MRLRFVTCLILLLSTTNLLLAQDQQQANSLSAHFNSILEKSETYENYKVIKTSELVCFKSAMLDSLMSYQKEINALETNLNLLKGEFESLKLQFEITQLQLAASEEQNFSMPFLWFTVNKSSYNAVLWSFIALLHFFYWNSVFQN